MSDNAENLCLALAEAVEAAMPAVLEDLADDVRKRIGVPVERRGGRVVRSKPGEPPRRDTGRLQASTSVQRLNSDSRVQGTVSVDTSYAKQLNKTRPIFGDVLTQRSSAIVDAIAVAIPRASNL